MPTKHENRKTIGFKELQRLAFCNSDKLPTVVELHGERLQWVGIGWVSEGTANGTEVLVVDEPDA